LLDEISPPVDKVQDGAPDWSCVPQN